MPLLAVLFVSTTEKRSHADDWPQWLGPKRDGIWREEGILAKFPKDGPKIVWRTPIGGGYSGPAVANGKVYITDRQLPEGVTNPRNQFSRQGIKGTERVLCLDQNSGKILWKKEYPCTYRISYPVGPRTTPLVANGKVYALGAMGDLLCLDAKSGDILWSKNFPKDYGARVPLWGFAAHPLLDGDRLICMVGGNGSTVVAFDRNTGKEIWKSLDIRNAELGYCPPMIYEAGGKRQLIIWHPESVNGLNPETGKPYWSQRFNVKANLTIPTPRLSEDNILFVTSFYNGSMAIKLNGEKPSAKRLWKGKGRSEQPSGTQDLHAIMCTPFIKNGYIYGVGSYGELRCVKAATGERVWESLKATGSKQQRVDRWNNAFIVQQDDRCFLFNEKGELVIAQLTPKGYTEMDRAKILAPTTPAMGLRRVVWTHPAFAGKCMFARNDKEIVCVSLAAKE